MDNSPHKGVYQLNYAENLTTKKAWNVAMVICVIQVRREKLKVHALKNYSLDAVLNTWNPIQFDLAFGCSGTDWQQ